MDIPETRDRDTRAALIGGVPMPVPSSSPAMAPNNWLSCFFPPEGELGDGKEICFGDGEAFAEGATL
jgi:hypothetical protein